MPYYGRFGYVKMMLFLMTKLFCLCRLFSIVRTRFVCGLHYSERSTNRCSRRCVRDWSRWLRRFFPNMGGSITYGSIHHLLRHMHSVGLKDSTVADLLIFISWIFVRLLDLVVCILVMQRLDVIHNALYPFDATFWDNKVALYRKMQLVNTWGSQTTVITGKNPNYYHLGVCES